MADPRSASAGSTPATEPRTPALEHDSRRLLVGAVVLNALLLVAALLVYLTSKSQLVLAQGSDSLLDIAAGVILTISVSVGRQPKDEDHHFGHDRAEPIGALITAVFAGILGFEVLRSATWSLITGAEANMDVFVLSVLGGKFALKACLLAVLTRRIRGRSSSALNAIRVDTRNDVLACASSLTGYALARGGMTWADAALALPVGLYIGYSGLSLARENLRYLMGEAPSPEVLDEIRTLASSVGGVLSVRNLRAQYIGQELHAEITILIKEDLSATQSHDLALDVRKSVEAHPLVGEVFVHADTHSARAHS